MSQTVWASTRGLIATGGLVVLLVAMTVAAWDDGSNADATPTAFDGQYLFHTKSCVACHDIDAAPGGGSVGPNLTNVSQVAAARVEGMTAVDYVRQSVRDPGAYIVPGYGKVMPTLRLTDAEVEALVEYLLEGRP